MSTTRVIPVLSISGRQLVKTVRFRRPKYIGDPLNAIKIFNDKEVDELVIVDIERSKKKEPPNYALIEEMAGESFMPLGYGGGISSFDEAQKVFACGIEKIILNSICVSKPEIISEIASHYGSQSVVVCIDYKKQLLRGKVPVFISGTKIAKSGIADWAIKMQSMGAGEIILQDVDRDGTFTGYDLDTIKEVTAAVGIPVVALGGGRGAKDFKAAIMEGGASAVAAGSHFIYKNNNHESILINYLNAL